MVIDGDKPETLEDVVEYSKEKLAPTLEDPESKDHWFDDVKEGFDTLWCAVARLELMAHCGLTSDEVGGPVLVECRGRKKMAKKLKRKKKGQADECDPVVVIRKMYIKKPPPGAPPWGH